jgi:hypothetical protein
MFQTFHRKCWRLYLSLARARARLTTRRHLEQRDWFGKLSTNKLLLSLWLLGAALYTAHASYISYSQCGSGMTETVARYPVKVDMRPTGSVGQRAPTLANSLPAKVAIESSAAEGPPQRAEASLAAGDNSFPSVWGISIIDPAELREGWVSGKYLTPNERPQAQAAPQKTAQTGLETNVVSEQTEPSTVSNDPGKRRGLKWHYVRRPRVRFGFGMYP